MLIFNAFGLEDCYNNTHLYFFLLLVVVLLVFLIKRGKLTEESSTKWSYNDPNVA